MSLSKTLKLIDLVTEVWQARKVEVGEDRYSARQVRSATFQGQGLRKPKTSRDTFFFARKKSFALLLHHVAGENLSRSMMNVLCVKKKFIVENY